MTAARIPEWLFAQTAADAEELSRPLSDLDKSGELRARTPAPLRQARKRASQDVRYMRQINSIRAPGSAR